MSSADTMTASRREFLISAAAGITFAFTVPELAWSEDAAASKSPLVPNAWVRILPDDTVVILSAASELGQGSMTALPLVLAEELDADWDKVRIEFSPPDAKVYGNPIMFGAMLTIASIAVPGYFKPLRLAGAKARRSLMQAAADIWKVAVVETSTEPNVVVHKASGRRMTYGELAAAVKTLPDPPDLQDTDLKPNSQFRLIGKDVVRRDLVAKIEGTADYAINVQAPGMLYATVLRSPFHGAAPGAVVADAVRRVPNIVEVKTLPDAVAVIGSTMEAVLQGQALLQVQWEGAAEARDFDDSVRGEAFLAEACDPQKPARIWDGAGDVNEALRSGGRLLERNYRTDYVYHAQLEPLNAVAWVKDQGASVEVWAGTQAPAYAVQSVAKALGIEPAAVTLHRSYSGGAFGRRAAFDQDFVVDAAVLSKQLGRPVKVISTRQNDLKAGRFKPMTGQWLQAALDGNGEVVAWRHRVACEDPSAMQDPTRWQVRKESPIVAMGGSNLGSYDIANRLVEFVRQPVVVRVAPLRGTGATPTRFAVEQFVDEIAAEVGIDPFDMRLRLLRKSPRGRAVVERAAKMSNWGRAEPNTAKGIAFSDYGYTMLAVVAEITLDRGSGEIRARRLWAAVDAGLVLQPDNLIALIEGGLNFGVSNALKERVTFARGAVVQSSFDDYPILRMNEAPELAVEIVHSEAPPTGIGEIAAVPVPAAIANAFATLTGRRLRHLPLLPERVKAALA